MMNAGGENHRARPEMMNKKIMRSDEREVHHHF